MQKIDTDNNGFIDEDEFRLLMSGKIKERNQEEELRKAFRIYDQDDTGLIEFDDLRRVANELTEGKKESDEMYLLDSNMYILNRLFIYFKFAFTINMNT